MRGSEFGELAAFAAVVEHGSFARAAAKLGISPSRLSQTIRQLEERLGTRLLHRSTRSVSPTEAGHLLNAGLKPALAELEAAVGTVTSREGELSGTLRLHVPRLAAETCLEPSLKRFYETFPRIILDVTVNRHANLALTQS